MPVLFSSQCEKSLERKKHLGQNSRLYGMYDTFWVSVLIFMHGQWEFLMIISKTHAHTQINSVGYIFTLRNSKMAFMFCVTTEVTP